MSDTQSNGHDQTEEILIIDALRHVIDKYDPEQTVQTPTINVAPNSISNVDKGVTISTVSDTLTQLDVGFPVNVTEFIRSVKGTDNEVYGVLLQLKHSKERHTINDWLSIINSYASQPAY